MRRLARAAMGIASSVGTTTWLPRGFRQRRAWKGCTAHASQRRLTRCEVGRSCALVCFIARIRSFPCDLSRGSVARGYSGGAGGLTRCEPRANCAESLATPDGAASTPARSRPSEISICADGAQARAARAIVARSSARRDRSVCAQRLVATPSDRVPDFEAACCARMTRATRRSLGARSVTQSNDVRPRALLEEEHRA